MANAAYWHAPTVVANSFDTAVPAAPGTAGQVLAIDAAPDGTHITTHWITAGAGAGTVTSFSAPTGFTVNTASTTPDLVMPAGWATGSLLLGNGAASVTNLAIGATPNFFLMTDGTTASWNQVTLGKVGQPAGATSFTYAANQHSTWTFSGSGSFDIVGPFSSTGQITSSLATGTAPFSIASTTVVPNLNVSQLLGGTWEIPGTLGSTTPNTADITKLTTSVNMLDPRSPSFADGSYVCKGDGTDTSAHATACWQNAEAYMQAHGGAILCAAGTTWSLDRVQVNSYDTFNGTTMMNGVKGCTISPTTDAAFVPATPLSYLSNVTFRNMEFSGGVNPIDFPFINGGLFDNIHVDGPSGCGINVTMGERNNFDITASYGAGNGFAAFCGGDASKSLFSGTIPAADYGLARTDKFVVMALGASPTHYSQWGMWVGGNGFDASHNIMITCFYTGSVGCVHIGTAGLRSLEGSDIVGIDLDHIADGLSIAASAVDMPGEIDGSTIAHYNGGFNGNNVTADMILGPLVYSTVQDSWFSTAADNITTFGLKLNAVFQGCLIGVHGGVFAATPSGVCMIGSTPTPSNLKGGTAMMQLSDNSNNDIYINLNGSYNAGVADTATFHIWRNTGAAGAGSDDFSLSPTAVTFAHSLASPSFSGTPDASAATQFKLPVGAGFTTAAQGEVGYDSTAKLWHSWVNGADQAGNMTPATNWYSTYKGTTPTNGAVLSATVNKAGVWGQFLDRAVSTGHLVYETGTTADNTAATYDFGIATGVPGGTCTVIANIGPTAGTTFAPTTSTWISLPWVQGTVTIPAGRIYGVLTTSQTGTPATLFRSPLPVITGTFQFNITALSIATGGTLPPTFTCPADTSIAGVSVSNIPAIVLQP